MLKNSKETLQLDDKIFQLGRLVDKKSSFNEFLHVYRNLVQSYKCNITREKDCYKLKVS